MKTLNNVKLSLNFNLRQPKKTVATSQLYCIVAVNGKQSKVPMGLKVFAHQWDKRKQLCRVDHSMVQNDQVRNLEVNRKLSAIRCAYDELFCYLCGQDGTISALEIEREIRYKINSIISVDMASKRPPKRTVTASTLLKKAFTTLYGVKADGKVQGTLKVFQIQLNAYLKFIDASRKGDTPQNFLTQVAINDYKNHLRTTGIAAKTLNNKVQLIVRLINTIAETSEGDNNGVVMVAYKPITDSRRNDEMLRRELTNDELNAVMQCDGLSAKEIEFRDLFAVQLACGLRVSDLPKLFNGDYKKSVEDGRPCYIVNTQKENITAIVMAVPTITEIQKKYSDGFKYINFNSKSFDKDYNNALKSIFKKANCSSIETYFIDQAGRKVQKCEPLHRVINSHYARHTFITQKLRDGFTPEKLALFTGHADDKMIREIYGHLTPDDKVKDAISEVNRVEGITVSTTDNDDKIIAAQAREIHAYKKADEQREIDRLKMNLEGEKGSLLFFVCAEYDLMEIDSGDIVAPVSGKIVRAKDSNKSLYEILFGNAPTLEEYIEMENQGITLIDAYNSGKIKMIFDID